MKVHTRFVFNVMWISMAFCWIWSTLTLLFLMLCWFFSKNQIRPILGRSSAINSDVEICCPVAWAAAEVPKIIHFIWLCSPLSDVRADHVRGFATWQLQKLKKTGIGWMEEDCWEWWLLKSGQEKYCWWLKSCTSWLVVFPLFIGFHTSQVVQDFSHQQ